MDRVYLDDDTLIVGVVDYSSRDYMVKSILDGSAAAKRKGEIDYKIAGYDKDCNLVNNWNLDVVDRLCPISRSNEVMYNLNSVPDNVDVLGLFTDIEKLPEDTDYCMYLIDGDQEDPQEPADNKNQLLLVNHPFSPEEKCVDTLSGDIYGWYRLKSLKSDKTNYSLVTCVYRCKERNKWFVQRNVEKKSNT